MSTYVLIENLVTALKTLLPLTKINSLLPALHSFHLQADTKFKVSASTIEIGGSTYVTANIETPFEICVDATLLYNWLSSHKKATGRLTIDYDPGFAATYNTAPCTWCDHGLKTCPHCKGEKQVVPVYAHTTKKLDCYHCKATGTMQCKNCKGTGELKTLIAQGKPATLNLAFENRRCTLPTLSADEFPVVKFPEESVQLINIAPAAFHAAMNMVYDAIEKENNRPILHSVYIKATSGCLTYVATDGYRLHIYNTTTEFPDFGPILLTLNAVDYLLKVISAKSTQDLALEVLEDNTVIITHDRNQWRIMLQYGKYSDYQQVMPKRHKVEFTVNRVALLADLEPLKPYFKRGDNKRVTLTMSLKENCLTLKGSSQEAGSSEVDHPVQYTWPEQTLYFNYFYMVEALNALTDETVTVKFINATCPITIEDSHGFTEIMPMSE